MPKAPDMTLSLNSDAFNALKHDYDIILKDTLSTMELKGSDNAKVTITVDISLETDSVPDYNAKYEATRQAVMPVFKHKVASVIQLKEERTGRLEGSELVWDEVQRKYILRPLDKSHGQQSLYPDGQPDPGATKELPSGVVLALPGDATDPVIDADFTELPPDGDDPAVAGAEYTGAGYNYEPPEASNP